ncbi:hypothetical protein DCAR_0625952 [Daucus carota subsp. sativus]|uniref:Uncharacterized protein n=1 Tax=Daucus carota subsp. sativus TaxID=79200 RepID=A0A161WUB6_DAUCS|nr:PREDICTED: ethylene-responsive transcription factor ERF015-like [Daucus carota subsp. sativus]XP_017255137.1 PREDICTED: ethylene-responsive transcription factor ERF015-like [Daucus carota subsp. sativus]XP_017255138.1 PREDICTED: ethylene-responsive transcription factor ERF015-like [Daucus carota subsp. sativus]XP_017255139.1 PREDICTED: ethylene-responsive transcription factor ERF015-like [Daucus carota subsp. sativus]WOH06524.1 hypothetical protein DCAR_0625952 [Daucus carota subsp. sativus]
MELPKKTDGSSSSTPQTAGAKRLRGPYRGARLRDGKWVAEIRIPKTKKRIWLGSHDTAEAAAQAYDDASFCIYGVEGPCNFPNNRRPQVASQLIGSKSTEEIRRIVEQSTSAGAAKVSDTKSPSKLSAACHLINRPVVQDQLDLSGTAAHKTCPEPVVTSNVSEVERHVTELDFTGNASEVEPYIPTFSPEEPPLPWENLPFDEAFIKESDDWILDFMAEPATQKD